MLSLMGAAAAAPKFFCGVFSGEFCTVCLNPFSEWPHESFRIRQPMSNVFCKCGPDAFFFQRIHSGKDLPLGDTKVRAGAG